MHFFRELKRILRVKPWSSAHERRFRRINCSDTGQWDFGHFTCCVNVTSNSGNSKTYGFRKIFYKNYIKITQQKKKTEQEPICSFMFTARIN